MAETRIGSDALSAVIAHHGAELQSLKDRAGNELMSSGDPGFWTGRAPLLFPIVGRLHADTLRTGGREYAMAKHGFARKSDFTLVEACADEALFRLTDSAETRAQFPFAFVLDAHFRVRNLALEMTVTVSNSGYEPLPFSFGFHPAFAWPLPYGAERRDHRITFEADEPGLLARVTPYGTIAPEPVASPVKGNSFTLDDSLFENDALVWPSILSRRLSYGAPGARALDIEFPDTPSLGIWTKPGAGFVCVEPWAGIADPEGFRGEFRDKPGVMMLEAETARSFRMNVILS